MRYDEAIDRFGVDKPDTRYGLEMRDVTDIVKGYGTAFDDDDVEVVRVINAKQLGLKGFSRRDIRDLETLSKRLSVDGKVVFVVKIEEVKWCAIISL